jgi:hypothetical protein
MSNVFAITSKDIYARRKLVVALQAPICWMRVRTIFVQGRHSEESSQMIKANAAAGPTAPESNAAPKTAVAPDGVSIKTAPSLTVVQSPDAARQGLMNDITHKWSRFSKEELGGFKGKDDLVAQVAIKYGIDKTVALREVDGVFKGRSL